MHGCIAPLFGISQALLVMLFMPYFAATGVPSDHPNIILLWIASILYLVTTAFSLFAKKMSKATGTMVCSAILPGIAVFQSVILLSLLSNFDPNPGAAGYSSYLFLQYLAAANIAFSVYEAGSYALGVQQ